MAIPHDPQSPDPLDASSTLELHAESTSAEAATSEAAAIRRLIFAFITPP
jgi:hypothetical protein